MSRIFHLLAIGLMLALSVPQPALAGNGPNWNSVAVVSVEFSNDCTSATIESSKGAGRVAVILTNGAWEKVDTISGGPTHTVGIDPDGPNSDQAIHMLYVKSGSYKQKDLIAGIPGHVGYGFGCAFFGITR